MSEEIRSLDWIAKSARAAADDRSMTGTPPRNPCTPGSAGFKAWARAFYEHSTAPVVHTGLREFVAPIAAQQ